MKSCSKELPAKTTPAPLLAKEGKEGRSFRTTDFSLIHTGRFQTFRRILGKAVTIPDPVQTSLWETRIRRNNDQQLPIAGIGRIKMCDEPKRDRGGFSPLTIQSGC